MDDNDRLFVSDPGLRHVLIFDKDHKAEDVITDGMVDPGGLAIDTKNRLLYVADVELDQILVYDADTLKLLRKIGTTGHKHELTTPGDFSKPAGVAVDAGRQSLRSRYLQQPNRDLRRRRSICQHFWKSGRWARILFDDPKGVAIDGDGHIWVADGMQDRVQVFNKEGQLLISMGGHGLLPGQFQGLVGITIDKQNRVFTTEIFPGRAQEFQYVSDAEADALREKRAAEREKAAAAKSATAPASTPAATPPNKPN